MELGVPGDCHMLYKSGLLFIGLLPTLAAPNNLAQTERDTVTLTMTERAGVAREAERVIIGVSLPKGLVNSTPELCLLQGGRAIPCEIIPVNKWWDDGTLRWVHLIFQSNCPANGKASVTLTRGLPAPMHGQRMTVTDEPDRFVIDTGAIGLEVRKKGFNVLDVVRAKNQAIINAHKRGLCVQVEGQEYRAALDPTTTVALEESGTCIRGSKSVRSSPIEKWLPTLLACATDNLSTSKQEPGGCPNE
jgi:hypothetical protein